MGYTHYWNKPDIISDVQWDEFVATVSKIVKAAPAVGISLVAGYDDPGTAPIVDQEAVILNGIGDDAREDFAIYRYGLNGFAFCKTAQKPYDAVVVACLLSASRIIDLFTWSSDGSNEEGYTDDGMHLLSLIEEDEK